MPPIFLLTSLHLHDSYRRLPLAAALLIIVCATTGLAQVGGIDPDPGDPGTGGKNTIQGTIFLPGGQRLDRRVKVKLTGLANGELFQMSDDSGAFRFRRLQSGRYLVVVDAGKDFDVHSEAVDIIEPASRRNDPGVTVPIYITLRLRAASSSSVPGTVDAKAAGLPEAAKDLYKQAMDSAKSGDAKKAIGELEKALQIYPNFMAALNQLGVQYMEIKDWDKASEPLRKAIGISPEAFHPHLNYGIVLLQLKKYRDAAAELNTAVQKDSSSGTAQFYLGRAMVSLGNYDAAENALRQAISIGGEETVEAHRYLGAVYIEKHDSARAAEELDMYLKLAPKAKDAERIRAIVKDLRSQASANSK
jgi:tetratricopeptide (TPR) repeat protein